MTIIIQDKRAFGGNFLGRGFMQSANSILPKETVYEGVKDYEMCVSEFGLRIVNT